MNPPAEPDERSAWILRLAVALFVGGVSGFRAWVVVRNQLVPGDFAQIWFAARAILHGQDPYALIGPGRAFEWPAPMFYPLPAAFVGIPFVGLSHAVAGGVFVGIGTAAFAWALTATGWWPLVAIISASMMVVQDSVQWSPLLAAGLVLAPLSALWIAKPTIGFALFAARPNRWAIGGGLILLVLSFLVLPDWVTQWRVALHGASFDRGRGFPYVAPVRYPGGILALACLLRWRRPEARMVAALACVPHTVLHYETMPLFLVPRGPWQSVGLTTLSWVALRWLVSLGHLSAAAYIDASGQALVLALYLPCTLFVLLRPNEGEAPAWLENHVATWPAWLRGKPSYAS